MSKKANVYNAFFFSVIFGVLFAFVGSAVQGKIDWPTIPPQIIVAIIVGFVVGLVIPSGKWGAALAMKVSKPGSVLFRFIMFSVILIVMLIFMCPLITLFMVCVLGKAPIAVAVPLFYSMFIPFYITGIIFLVIFGDRVAGFAVKCAEPKQKIE